MTLSPNLELHMVEDNSMEEVQRQPRRVQLEDAVEDAVEEEEELAWQEGREAGPQVTQQT